MTAFARVRVEAARPDDVDRVAALLAEAGSWMLGRGIRQWPSEVPPEQVRRLMRRADVYLAWEGAQAVGTFSLQAQDPVLWGAGDDALYLHRLTVRRSHRGLGRHLLAWAERTAAAAGRRYLRLDCKADNRALRAYYERAGYRHRGDVAVAGWTSSRYEKPL